jgi:Zn-dependent protease/CBS domain-containing protein
MRWSFRVARVAGSEIRIHLTFLLLLGWIAVAYAADGGWRAAASGVGFMVLLFASVLLHELGHAAAARRYGIATPDITLLPIGGVARIARIPRQPRQELVIALGGPAVTLAIIITLWVIVALAGMAPRLIAAPGESLAELAVQLMEANAALLVFNLLPAFPMDGGRVLRALLAMRMDYLRATRIAARVGQAFALLFVVAGLFLSPLLILIALFVFLGAREEAALTEVHALAARLPISAAMMTEFGALPADATLEDAAARLTATGLREFAVVDAAGRVVGALTRPRLVAALAGGVPGSAVREVMTHPVPTIRADAPLDAALERMEETRTPVLAVVDEAGRLVGLITPEMVGEMVMLHTALARNGRALSRFFVKPPSSRAA